MRNFTEIYKFLNYVNLIIQNEKTFTPTTCSRCYCFI
jgi:hypothetical protein